MNKAVIILAGLLLMSSVVFAENHAEKTAVRWTIVINNTISARDKIQAYGNENKIDFSPQLAELQTKIDTMNKLKGQLNFEERRNAQKDVIAAFQQTRHEARKIITEIIRK